MLAIEDLFKRYDDALALEGVSLSLGSGDILGLVGPNGSGKTTLVKIVVGLITPTAGSVSYCGQSTAGNARFRKDVGAVLDGSRNTHWRLTVKQNAKYFAALHHVPPKEIDARVSELATQLGIAQYLNTQVAKLSTGNKRKVSLLCALAHRPKVVLMDEPTLGLDVETSAQLMDFIREQAKMNGCCFLITSHDFGFIDKVCNRVAVIIDGKIVLDSSLAAVIGGTYKYVATYSFREAIPADFERKIRNGAGFGHNVVKHTDASLSIGFSDLADGLSVLGDALQYQELLALYENRYQSVDHLYREMMVTYRSNKPSADDAAERSAP